MENNQQDIVYNSLMGLVDLMALGQAGQAQLSQTDTIHYNNRYYLISSDRMALSYLYACHGIVQTLIDQPVDDAFRPGFKILSDQLNEDDIKELQAYLERENIINTIGQTVIWSRLYGGAGLVINAGQKADEELDKNKINKNTPLSFYDADLWELCDSSNVSPNQSVKSINEIPYNYYGVRLHRSKVLRINGKKAPSFIRPKLRGWGMSEIERIIRSINQYLKNQDLIFQLLDEAKIDVYKIKNYTSSIASQGGTDLINRRIQAANAIKNFSHALTLDREDDYSQKQISFAGLAEIFKEIRIQVASDLKIPMTKLFGLSASGFNAGDDDIENYNGMVEAEIRGKVKHLILDVLELCCLKLFEFTPDDMTIEFEPLRILSHEQEENVKTQKQNRILANYDRGLMTDQEAIAAQNADGLTSITIDENKGISQEEANRNKTPTKDKDSLNKMSNEEYYKRYGKNR
jgi:uncharacterized protein